MRSLILFCLLVLINMAPVTQAQEQDDKSAETSEGIPLMWVYGSDLPACSVFQGSLLTIRIVLPHKSIITRASELESIDDLLAFAGEDIDQRIWEMSPPCAEAVEVSWFVSQVAGDFAAARALELAGLASEANFYQQQAELGSARFDEIFAYIHEEGWHEPLTGDDGSLAECTVAEQTSLDKIASDFNELLVGPVLKVETSADLIAYGEAHVDWRERIWTSLPACTESVQLGVLMGVVARDFATAFALSLSGIDTDDSPYMLRALGGWMTFMDHTILKDFAEDTGNAAKTYYVTANSYANIRSCASTNCSVVTTTQNGEALTVIDDSKDWYEVRLENGETAFIAGFLMSATPPGG